MTPIQDCIKNKNTGLNPIWIMRQAGRYLPEFRKIRAQNTDFIKLCLNESLSTEITLQPIKRFDFDAAIIFSDILMLPFGLGQEVKFEKGLGPKLGELNLDLIENVSKATFTDFELRHGAYDNNGKPINNEDIAYTKAKMSAHISKQISALPGFSHNYPMQGEMVVENATPSTSVIDKARFYWMANTCVDQTFEFFQRFRRTIEISAEKQQVDPDNPTETVEITIDDLSASQVGLYAKQILTHSASLEAGVELNEIFVTKDLEPDISFVSLIAEATTPGAVM